jgi:hypothetical protein
VIRRLFTHRKVTSAAGQAAGPGARRARRSRPALESLEGRTLLSFYGSEHLISLNPQVSDNFESDNASSRNGTSVAVWVNTFSGTDHDIWAQRFDQTGRATGAPIQVDFLGTDDSYAPHVAMDGSDRFVVTWEDLNPDGTYNVMMRYFSASGAPLTNITRVSPKGSYDYDPDVAASNGSFVITWAHFAGANNGDIYAERFVVSNGVPQGQGIFLVNGDGNSEARPSVAMQQNGIFVIAYERQFTPGGSDWDILASQYDGSGVLVRGGLPINTDPSTELNPSISMDNSGNAVIAYERITNGESGIYANRLTWSTGAVAPRITVRDVAGITERDASVALSPTTGDFVVAYNIGGTFTTQVAEVNSANAVTSISGAFLGFDPAVSIDGLNRYVVTYTRFDADAAGTNSFDIFSRRSFLN